MDSNHRPAVYETAALPLSYAGTLNHLQIPLYPTPGVFHHITLCSILTRALRNQTCYYLPSRH